MSSRSATIVGRIKAHSNIIVKRIPSKDNPSDLASRDLKYSTIDSINVTPVKSIHSTQDKQVNFIRDFGTSFPVLSINSDHKIKVENFPIDKKRIIQDWHQRLGHAGAQRLSDSMKLAIPYLSWSREEISEGWQIKSHSFVSSICLVPDLSLVSRISLTYSLVSILCLVSSFLFSLFILSLVSSLKFSL